MSTDVASLFDRTFNEEAAEICPAVELGLLSHVRERTREQWDRAGRSPAELRSLVRAEIQATGTRGFGGGSPIND
jgi:hypothetical protein